MRNIILVPITVMLGFKLGAGLVGALAMLITQGIPPGTALPVMLGTTLNAKKDKPGQKIAARLMQDIPLPAGEKVKAGAHVTGHIVSVTKIAGGGSRMVLKFDQLQTGGKTIPLVVSARAIAAMDSVYAAELPINADSNYVSSNEWVMRQVGGEVVNRAHGVVASSDSIVGRWDGAPWGKLTTAVEGNCTATDGNGIVQALWVFSTSACGLYGFKDVKLVRDGRGEPLGEIVLEFSKDAHIGSGSGWFLLVGGTAAAGQ